MYGSQLLKDAVCDSLRESTGQRPNIAPERPDVRLHLHVEQSTALVSVDFSGESLHRRGYRLEGGRAPLKENVAAAILLRAGWREIARGGGMLVDPMCGSGTFLTEAALIAGDIAPALAREYFGFLGWRGHDAELWERLRAEALARRAARSPRRCIFGSDADPAAVRMALDNAASAGVAEWLHVERRALSDGRPGATEPDGTTSGRPARRAGSLITNPPYGERIGSESGLSELYAELGRVLRERFEGWQAAILSGNPALARNLGMYAKRTHRVFNGDLECRLLRFDLGAPREPRTPEAARARAVQTPGSANVRESAPQESRKAGPVGRARAHRLFPSFTMRTCRNTPLPSTSTAASRGMCICRNTPPRSRWTFRARASAAGTCSRPCRKCSQCRSSGCIRESASRRKAPTSTKNTPSPAGGVAVREGGLEFWVNFRDYLDTGLFLDHRIVRGMLRNWAADADFLNLFCYTGSATVYAAAGGARSSLSVDLSNTYLEWAQENLSLNGLAGARHRQQRADCMEWLESESAGGARFDLIFVDPPTFSNSKRMQGVLDVQRDHVGMIRHAMRLLRPAGRLVFSTNYSRFKLDAAALAEFEIEDLSAKTIPKDFERNARIHRCFVLRHRAAAP